MLSLSTGCVHSSLPTGSDLLEPRGDLETSQPRDAQIKSGAEVFSFSPSVILEGRHSASARRISRARLCFSHAGIFALSLICHLPFFIVIPSGAEESAFRL